MVCNYNQATLLDSKIKPRAVSLGHVVDKNHFTYLLKKSLLTSDLRLTQDRSVIVKIKH